MSTECYRCGGDDHFAATCPTPPPTGNGYRRGHVRPPRAREEDMHAWCASIREALGWVKGEPRKKDTTDGAVT